MGHHGADFCPHVHASGSFTGADPGSVQDWGFQYQYHCSPDALLDVYKRQDNIITDYPVRAREILYREETTETLMEYLKMMLR